MKLRRLEGFDAVALDASKRKIDDATGFMEVPGTLARAGIQEYRAHELGLADRPPNSVVRLYRSADELAKACASANNKPITLGHPDKKRFPKGVTADNYAQLAKGHASDVHMDGPLQNGTLHVQDAAGVRALKAGTQELSNGYNYTLDLTPGTSPEGQAYDGLQTDIVINHNAIVPTARGGRVCRAADENTNHGERKMKTIAVDGVEYELEGTHATLVTSLRDARDAALTDLAVVKTTADKAVADAQAQVEALRKQVLTADQQEALVQDRASVLAECATRCPTIKIQGLDTAAIRRAMLADLTGKSKLAKKAADAATGGGVNDKTPDATIKIALDVVCATVAEDAAETTQRRNRVAAALGSSKPVGSQTGDEVRAADAAPKLVGRSAYVDNMTKPGQQAAGAKQ